MTTPHTHRTTQGQTARFRRAFTGGLALAAGLLVLPAVAEEIDIFDAGPGWDGVGDPSRLIECEIVDGQLKLSRGAPHSSSLTQVWYLRSYVVPEDRPLEFRLDSVSASSEDVATAFFFGIQGNPDNQGYALHRTQKEMWIGKYHEPHPMSWFHLRTPIPIVTAPVTLVYSMTRQGENLEIRAKVVLRDTPEDVVVELPPVIDTPGRDSLHNGSLEHEASGDDLRLRWHGTWTLLEAVTPLGPWWPSTAGVDVALGVSDKACSCALKGQVTGIGIARPRLTSWIGTSR